ncbi:hypothetical protein B0H13DRAFT_1859702 [Mycena leptocephala]|nr:hypothetical protein B0H13DRAFT_1859702 [Mycena leptocephala]
MIVGGIILLSLRSTFGRASAVRRIILLGRPLVSSHDNIVTPFCRAMGVGGIISLSMKSTFSQTSAARFRGSRTKTQGVMRESVGATKKFPKRKFFVRALGSDISCEIWVTANCSTQGANAFWADFDPHDELFISRDRKEITAFNGIVYAVCVRPQSTKVYAFRRLDTRGHPFIPKMARFVGLRALGMPTIGFNSGPLGKLWHGTTKERLGGPTARPHEPGRMEMRPSANVRKALQIRGRLSAWGWNAK